MPASARIEGGESTNLKEASDQANAAGVREAVGGGAEGCPPKSEAGVEGLIASGNELHSEANS
jgi:hypothetical protein